MFLKVCHIMEDRDANSTIFAGDITTQCSRAFWFRSRCWMERHNASFCKLLLVNYVHLDNHFTKCCYITTVYQCIHWWERTPKRLVYFLGVRLGYCTYSFWTDMSRLSLDIVAMFLLSSLGIVWSFTHELTTIHQHRIISEIIIRHHSLMVHYRWCLL